MTLWPIFAAIGGLAFAFAAVPTAVKTIAAGKSGGTPVSIAWAIFIGCVCLYVYLTGMYGFDPLLAAVYGLETGSWGVLLLYHYFPRRTAAA